MKFIVREKTDHLNILFQDTGGLSAQELHREARRTGKFAVDFHYVVQRNGIVEAGREPYVVAGAPFENSKTSVCILVDVGETGKMTDSQKVGLKDLLSGLKGTYPGVKVNKFR